MDNLGVGGVSLVEFLILYEWWAGERPCVGDVCSKATMEKTHPRYLRPGRPISGSAVPSGPCIDMWRSCGFLGALLRALGGLPGGPGRFLSLLVERCGHGLTSRPLEASGSGFLDDLLSLFRYPSLGPAVPSLLVLLGCGIVLLTSVTRSQLGDCS